MAGKNIMLVEGVADRNFFNEFLRKIGVTVEVIVTSPMDHGIGYDTKGGVYSTLPILVKQLSDGRCDHVAVVVDADHVANDGMGFTRTLESMSALLDKFDYNKRERVGQEGGFKFLHNDGLSALGLWIMPNNRSDGSLEEMVIQSSIDTEAKAIGYADSLLDHVPDGVRFKQTRRSKAQCAAWMSWQAVPGQGLQQAVRDDLVDMQKPLPLRLTAWIREIYL